MAYAQGVAGAMTQYGVKHADLKSTISDHAGTLAAGVATALLTAASGRDLWKSRKHEEHWTALKGHFNDTARLVDARAHVTSRDTAAVPITTKKELTAMVNAEFGGVPRFGRKVIISELAKMVEPNGGNAAMFPGLSTQYIISRPQELPEILDHELGHAADFREKKLTHKNLGPYKPTIIGKLYRPRYDKETMNAEIEAWRRAPGSPHKDKIQGTALGTYDTAFHRDRGNLLGGLATIGALVTANTLLLKLSADKHADHVQDRRAERTPSISATSIETLRSDALKVDHPTEGNHYTPLKDAHGNLIGYAVFRTVGGKLRLMTILSKEMTPKGTSLGHVLHAKTAAARRGISYYHQALDNTSPDTIGLFNPTTNNAYRDIRPSKDPNGRNRLREVVVNQPGLMQRGGVGTFGSTNVSFNPENRRYSFHVDTGVRDDAGRRSRSLFTVNADAVNDPELSSHLNKIIETINQREGTNRALPPEDIAAAVRRATQHRRNRFITHRALPAALAGTAALGAGGYLWNRYRGGEEKTAGRSDPRALAEFGRQLQPGDVVQFQTHGGDVAQQSLRKGLMHGAISAPIQKLTGSPQHHTALFAGIDPKTGRLKIIHNYEQGNQAKIVQDYLDNYSHQTTFHAYRPHGVTPEMGAAAAARAAELAAGPSSYAKNNLVAAGVRALGEKAPGSAVKPLASGVAARMATHCDPTTGICSALPVDAYTPVVGREKAVEMMVGHGVPRNQEALAATPASISKSPHMAPISQYHPADQVSVARGIAQRILNRGGTAASSALARLRPR